MVIKGGARGGPIALATHLARTDTNERVSIRELRGVTARDLRGALREMDSMGAAAESRRTLYHANIDTRIGEELTEAQKAIAVERLAARLGMSDQARAVVEHVKAGREHLHVVFLRIDLDRMAAISDSHNYRRHEEVARELEREFGHERVQGAHVERDGCQRPGRTPSHSEMQQADRSGITPQEAKARVTELWNQADTGKAFAAALENDGWILARGDKRDFVILDAAGETHSLAKRIDGAKAAQVRDRMADVDAAALPSVQEAKTLQAERRLKPDQAEKLTPAATAPREESEIVVLKITPPPFVTVTRPLELAQEPPRQAQAESQKPRGMEIAGHTSEATQRPSVEAEIPPPPPKRNEIEQRPTPAMFRQLFTAAAEITHRVIDKARQLFEREPVEAAKPEPIPPARPEPEHGGQPIRIPKPPRPIAPQPQHEVTPREKTEQAIRERMERERQSRSRMTADQLRAELTRQQSQDRNGPDI